MGKAKQKKLTRSKNRMIAGVCAGIAEYFDIDPTVVRLIWAVFSVMSIGAGVIAYIVAWLLMPER